jgi:hypothetical protein
MYLGEKHEFIILNHLQHECRSRGLSSSQPRYQPSAPSICPKAMHPLARPHGGTVLCVVCGSKPGLFPIALQTTPPAPEPQKRYGSDYNAEEDPDLGVGALGLARC